jgi:uncharacterized protein YxjI
MKQKLFSVAKEFYIEDSAGQKVFRVHTKIFPPPFQFSFQDLSGNERARVRQKLLAWKPTYEIYRDGTLYATVKKELLDMLHYRYSVSIPGLDGFEAREGDLLKHEYSFTRQGHPVATVSKRWCNLTDTYGVETAEGEDDVLILACTAVIDIT